MATPATADKRRVILDAAVRVFARQGFHTCRVADIADEAGVAYGLVYHYFTSKDEMLDTLFLERWDLMLAAIAEADAKQPSPREKLHAIAGFIVDSYRHDPDLMKVIIVEVTRAANTFGRTHLLKIREAYAQIAGIVERAQADGSFRDEVDPPFAALAFYGLIEQVLTGWIFDSEPVPERELENTKSLIVDTICRGLERWACKVPCLLQSAADDREPSDQAAYVVGTTRRHRRAGHAGFDARGNADLAARVRRGAAQ